MVEINPNEVCTLIEKLISWGSNMVQNGEQISYTEVIVPITYHGNVPISSEQYFQVSKSLNLGEYLLKFKELRQSSESENLNTVRSKLYSIFKIDSNNSEDTIFWANADNLESIISLDDELELLMKIYGYVLDLE